MMGIIKKGWGIGLMVAFTASCTYYQNEIFVPPVEEKTPTLEAEFVTTPPNTFNAAYWKTADYMEVNTNSIASKQVYEDDGLLNMNNMYMGHKDFNGGERSNLRMKAAYDKENLYILAYWNDNSYNASYANWLYNGPDDPNKEADSTGWTSQKNDDNLMIEFDVADGNNDIWKWSLALSEPMGYAADMYNDGNTWANDEGEPMYMRNAVDVDDNRSGPKYEWDGTQQQLSRELGGQTLLDPGYFVLSTTPFLGDITNGEKLYQTNCGICHGANGGGQGDFGNSGVPLNVPAWFNRYSRDGLDALLGNSDTHAGASFWTKLDEDEQYDLGARLKAFSCIPGYVLQNPTGSSADVKAYSDVLLGSIDESKDNPGYKVLIVRKLNTGNADDIQFNLSASRQYTINIYLADDDDLNLVGELDKTLTFK